MNVLSFLNLGPAMGAPSRGGRLLVVENNACMDARYSPSIFVLEGLIPGGIG